MKTYVVKIKDDHLDRVIKHAKEELAKRKTGYAVIYGYEEPNGRVVYFDTPIVKFNQQEVDEFVNGISNSKQGTHVKAYVLYCRHLDDSKDPLARYSKLFDLFAAMVDAFDEEHHEELKEIFEELDPENFDMSGPDIGSKLANIYMKALKK